MFLFVVYKQSDTIQLQAMPTNALFRTTTCCQNAFRHIFKISLCFTCLEKKGVLFIILKNMQEENVNKCPLYCRTGL